MPCLLHRHHDVEAGGAQLGDRRLQFRIEHVDHAAPIGAALGSRTSRDRRSARAGASAAARSRPVVLGELDQQQRRGLAAHECLERRPEHVDVAGEPDHGRVDQLDRDRRRA